MQKKDLSVIAASALVAFLATLALGWPRYSDAAGPEDSLNPLIKSPTIKSHGCEIALSSKQSLYKDSEKPVAELCIENRSDTAANLTLTLELYITPPNSPMSRLMPMHASRWKQDCAVVVERGKSHCIPLTPEVVLHGGETGFFSITLGDQHVNGGMFSVARDPLKTAQDVYEKLKTQGKVIRANPS